ncbi:ABC transporter ATP-binding protein [Halomarina pelagica]|uniref:ABC transporter ATP-binding protein n=1 Tax=Halomarina pelagica TaxID=2961599 RepID=UPI0020C2F37F|nr:ABC transporter ATP-binding protein [Halomarina sp. BND7]
MASTNRREPLTDRESNRTPPSDRADDPDRADRGRSRDERPLVEVDGLTKHFGTSRGVVDRLLGREPEPVRAVDDVSFTIERGDVLGIAGESGCGKTTLVKLLVRLHAPTDGTITFDGRDLATLSGEDERSFRRRVQMIFQDPFESLNPRMTVLDAVLEPLRINDVGDSHRERRERVEEVLNDVGLAPAEAYLDSFPRNLSGGERQRVAIARALVVDPDFVVCDEPVSMLDVSIRAGVLNLMKRLQDEYGLTYVFVSHDLSLIRYMCDRTAIMYLGEIVEQGPTESVVEDPKHPYTQALFDAVPEATPDAERTRANVTGEVPSPRDPPVGCRFHPRCAHVIPPDDWTGSQDAFRRAFQFKLRVTARDVDAELNEGGGTTDRDPVGALLARELALDLPEEHAIAGERGGDGRVDPAALDLPPSVRSALEDAAEAVLAGEYRRAEAALDGHVTSVCERRHPELRSADGQIAACHRYETDETDETDADPSGSAAGSVD